MQMLQQIQILESMEDANSSVDDDIGASAVDALNAGGWEHSSLQEWIGKGVDIGVEVESLLATFAHFWSQTQGRRRGEAACGQRLKCFRPPKWSESCRPK